MVLLNVLLLTKTYKNMESKTIIKSVKIPRGLYKKLENEMKKKKVSSFHKLMLMKLWE